MANKRISELSSRTPSATDLMLVGDPTTGYSYKCTLLETIGLGVPATRTITINGTTFDLSANRTWNVGTVTSVGLSMPSAFTVSGSPVTNNGTLTVTAAGTASQYIRGDGQLANLPTGGGGGGASVSYYLNGSVNQGTFDGTTYYEVNKTPVLGAGTDFSRNSNGYIASFITDAGDPGQLLIPAGSWNLELFLSATSGGGTPSYYVELYKYDGTTFTLIASNSTNPDVITGGTSVEAYFSTLAVPETVLTLTDRLALRVYVTPAGRTITLHTEDNNLCQIITTFTTGITALNGLTRQVQYFATGTSGTNFNIVSSNDTHTFNLPSSSATNRGLLTAADWTTFNGKQNALNGTGFVRMTGTTVSYITGTSSQFVKADGTLDSSVYVTSNIYNSDGTLTGNRTVTMGAFDLSLSANRNGFLNFGIYNADITNASARAGLTFGESSASRFMSIWKYGPNFAGYKFLAGGDAVVYNTSNGDIALLNDFATGRIKFGAGGASTAQMTLFSTGNFAINTTTDAGFRLDVNGTARIQAALTVANAGILTGTGQIRSEAYFNAKGGSTTPETRFRAYGIGRPDGGFGNAVMGGMYGFFSGASWPNGFGLAFFTAEGADISGGAFTTEKMTILANGNVGINITSPTYRLHVTGTAAVTGSLDLATAGSTRVTIGNTGDTAYKLSVDGDIRVYGNIRTGAPDGGSGPGIWKLGSSATGTFTLDTANCVEVEIGGTLIRLARVNPA